MEKELMPGMEFDGSHSAHLEVEHSGGCSASKTVRQTKVIEDLSVSKDGRKKTASIPFYKLFTFADRSDIILMVFATVGSVVNGVCMPLLTLLFGELINAFGQNSNDVDLLVHKVSKVALRFVYVGCGAAVASFAQVTFWMKTGNKQAARIRNLYLKAILRQDISFFDVETSTGEVVERMSGDTVLIQEALGEKVGKFLQLVSTFIGGFVIAFVKGWKLTLLLLATIPLIVSSGGAMAFLITKAATRGQEAYAEAGNIVEQVIGAIRTVMSFTGEKKAMEDYDKALKKAYKPSVQQGFATGLGLGCALTVMFCTYSLALWYGSKLIVRNQGYTGGAVINVIFGVLIGGMSLGQASPSVNAFASGQAAAYKMFEVIYRVPDIDVYNMKGLILDGIKGDIELQNIDFAYPTRPDVQIFSNFSLKIMSGITAALVGESGSGKSTVISLIDRFYDPQGGRVMIDEVDIRKLQLKWLRKQIGLVSQEPVLFGTSIRENIAYGKDEATFEEIKSAAELSNAANFINKMPEGYDTMVGEHGTQLSGGQKQRVAIARAILKDPCILLLDEATSALDAESEHLVQEALDRVMENCTTVVVAHRLTTIRNADLIAVVQHGAIVETGKHHDLIKKPDGAYAQLLHLQEMHLEKEVKNPNFADDLNIALTREEQRVSGRRSFTRSRSRSLSLGISRPSFSFRISDASRTGENADIQGNTHRTGIFHYFQSKDKCDLETEGSKSVQDVSIFRLATLNKPEIPIFFVGSLAAIMHGLVFPLFGLLISSIIKVFYETPHKLRKDANFWALMFVSLGSMCFIVLPIQMTCFAIGGSRLVQRVRLLTFEKILHQEIGWFDKTENSSGAVSARLSTDAAQVRNIVGDALALVVQNLATIISAFIISFTASWEMSLVVLGIVPLLGLQNMMHIKFMKGFSTDAKVMYEEASQVANDAVSSIRTVASFCAEDKVLGLYSEKCRVPLKEGIRQGLLSGTGFAFSNFVMYSSYALCFWFGAKLVHEGRANFRDVFRVFLAISMCAMSVSQSSGLAPDITKVQAAINSVFAILDSKSKIDSNDQSGIKLESVKGNIEFNHVSFKYPTRPDAQIFRDLCLLVQVGMTVALVGESGSGKSTVVCLLERFYDPDSGHILLDGVDLKKLQLKWLRQQIGLVSQEPVLFNDSIWANIVYGKDGIASDEQVVAAAEASNAHKFISSLPDGYNTCVGERGIQLSGGQKQRVAIARAILKNPKILLLDEATSALDAESEHVVQDALDKVMVGRSTIVIAHRLSTIKNADKIAVVKNGIIAEQGRHDELMSINEGAYSSLIKLHMVSS
eukprot:c29214_g2_i1 orf=143-4090(-)